MRAHRRAAPAFAENVHHLLWKVTILTIGIASFGMLTGSAIAATTDTLRKMLLAFTAAKLALYSGWMLAHDEFIYVIADTGIAMALVAALHGWSAMRGRDCASLWMLGAVGASALAAGGQASGFALHRHFNHNDMYHVIQIGAMALFYIGAGRLHDRSEQEETERTASSGLCPAIRSTGRAATATARRLASPVGPLGDAMRVRRKWLMALLTALVIQPSVAANTESWDLRWLLERRVRIQSPALGRGWHQGLFNRQRREPPCYVVITWKPRSSAQSPLRVASIIQIGDVSQLQAYSGPSIPVHTWAGRQSTEVTDDLLWQPVSPGVLEANRTCSALPSPARANEWRVSTAGLGPARVGMTLAEASRALRVDLVPDGAIDSPKCSYVTPQPEIKGLTIMVSRGRVVRFDVNAPGLKTLGGISVGDTESRIMEVYGSSVEITPHKYLAPDGNYLTIWSSDRRSAVRFETHLGKVTSFYAGRVPEVRYVEGCS
ncbi:MAG: hypothetical protein L0387_12135 [Acidobacteria bacterium]|nr:hypothetical protein [Acidobacteriota bacterium]MCI0724164.1 hypothetical protein [Acidobacteriota bacterium]